MLLLQLLVLVCLGSICYQDIRYRAVYWVCFPILSILLFYLKQDHTGIKDALIESGYTFLFFGIQLLLLWTYFSFKHRKPVNITTNYLGLGDILFLIAIAFYLSPVNYIIFYVASLIIVLIYTLIQRVLSQKDNTEIPLAGLQALLLGLILIFSIVKPSLRLYNDAWIYGL